MSLPWQKKQKGQTGVIVSYRKADGNGIALEPSAPKQDESNDSIEACAHDLLKALEAKDIKGIASAFRAAFEILSSEESPMDSDGDDFNSRNIAAAKERAE